MQVFQRSGSLIIIILLAVLLAACGDTTPQDPAATTNQNPNNQTAATNVTPAATMMPAATATAKQNGNMDAGNMMQGITITPDTGGNMAALISTGKATVNGMQVSVLLANKGFAVYYYKPDTTLQATCTGACRKTGLQFWLRRE